VGITGILLLWALMSTGLLAIILVLNPYALRVALARRLVWVCYQDGTLEPVPAKIEGRAYKTKKHGIFSFEKEDVLYYGNKPSIIVYKPYSKALRPKAVSVLKKLKEKGIDRYNVLYAILNAKLVGKEEVSPILSEDSRG